MHSANMKRQTFKEWCKEVKGIEDLTSIKDDTVKQIELNSEFQEYLAKWTEEKAKGTLTKEDKEELQKAIEESKASQKEMFEQLTKMAKEQGLALAKMQVGSPNEGQEKANICTEKNLSEIRNAWKANDELFFAKHSKGFTTDKATVTTASVANNANALDLPEIGQLATRRNALYEILPKFNVPASANGTIRYIDWDQATIARAAAMMAQQGTFPESTAVWKTVTESLKKVGDSIPWTDEFEYDDAFLVNELGQFLRTNVDLIKGSQIINGNNTGNNLNGMVTVIPAYTPVASGITDASIYDLFVKLRESIETGARSKYLTDFAVMNIADINKYKLKKDANNNYIMPPFVDANGTRIDGVTVIEDNAVTANTMFIGDRQFARIYETAGVGFEMGYINTDFTDGRKRMRLYNRLLFLIREADRSGFLKVTDIDAALTTLAT